MKSKKEQLRVNNLMRIRYECKCGHVVFVPEYAEFITCGWCGRRVYRTSKIEFIEKLKVAMNK